MAKCAAKKKNEKAEERSLSQDEIDDLLQAISGKETRYDTILDQSDIDELVNIATKVRSAETPKGTKKEALEYEMNSVLGKKPAKVRRYNFEKPEFLARTALAEISKIVNAALTSATATLVDELGKKFYASVSQVSVMSHEDFVKQTAKFAYSTSYVFEGKNTAAVELNADGSSCNTMILNKNSKNKSVFDTKAIKAGFLDLLFDSVYGEISSRTKKSLSPSTTLITLDASLLDGEGVKDGMGCMVAAYLELQAKGKKNDGMIVNFWFGKNFLDLIVENGVKLGGYDGSYADCTLNPKAETNALVSVGRFNIKKGEKMEKGKVFELNSEPGNYVEIVKGSKVVALAELVILSNTDSDNKLGIRIVE